MNGKSNHTIGYARKTTGALMSLWKRRSVSWEAKVTMCNGIG